MDRFLIESCVRFLSCNVFLCLIYNMHMRRMKKGRVRFIPRARAPTVPVYSSVQRRQAKKWKEEKEFGCFLFSVLLHWIYAEVNTLIHTTKLAWYIRGILVETLRHAPLF